MSHRTQITQVWLFLSLTRLLLDHDILLRLQCRDGILNCSNLILLRSELRQLVFERLLLGENAIRLISFLLDAHLGRLNIVLQLVRLLHIALDRLQLDLTE